MAPVELGTPLSKQEVNSLYVRARGNLADPIKNDKLLHKLEFLTEEAH